MRQSIMISLRAALLVLAMSISAVASEWDVRSEESHLGFVGTQAGSSFEGRFVRFEADIQFDPNALEDAHVEVTVDISSFHWIDEDRHTLAMSESWFDQGEYPAATFCADTIRHVEAFSYEAEGQLTLKGVTLDFTLPFELMIEGDVAHMTSLSQILRRDFGVGAGEVDDWFGNRVELSITLVADRR